VNLLLLGRKARQGQPVQNYFELLVSEKYRSAKKRVSEVCTSIMKLRPIFTLGGSTFTTFPRRRQHQRPLMTVWQDKGLLDEGQVKIYRHILCESLDVIAKRLAGSSDISATQRHHVPMGFQRIPP